MKSLFNANLQHSDEAHQLYDELKEVVNPIIEKWCKEYNPRDVKEICGSVCDILCNINVVKKMAELQNE